MFVDGQYVREISSAGIERRAYEGQNGQGSYDGDTAIDFDESFGARESRDDEGISWHELSVIDDGMQPVDLLIQEEEVSHRDSELDGVSQSAAEPDEVKFVDFSVADDYRSDFRQQVDGDAEEIEVEPYDAAQDRPGTFDFYAVQDEIELGQGHQEKDRMYDRRGPGNGAGVGVRRHRP